MYAFVLRFLQYLRKYEVFKSTTKSSSAARQTLHSREALQGHTLQFKLSLFRIEKGARERQFCVARMASKKTVSQVLLALLRLRRGAGAGETAVLGHAKQHGGATAKAVAAALKNLQKRKLARFVKTRDVWALTAAGKIEAAPLNKRASKPSGAAKGKAGAAGGPSKKASQRTEKSSAPKGAASKSSSADKSKKTATARRKHLSYEFGGNDDLSQALLSSKISRVIPGTNEARPTRPVPRVLRDDSSCPFASRGLMPLFLRIGAFLRTFHGLLKISPLEVAQLKDA